MRKDLFPCPGKMNILGSVALIVSVSPEGLHRGPFANNNNQVTGLRGPAHEKNHARKMDAVQHLRMPEQIQAVLQCYTNTLVSYKSKVPHKEPVLGKPVDQGNGECCKEKLEVCGVPKEKPRGAVIAVCKCLREEEGLFKVNTGTRRITYYLSPQQFRLQRERSLTIRV